jgi:hypothetical protein
LDVSATEREERLRKEVTVLAGGRGRGELEANKTTKRKCSSFSISPYAFSPSFSKRKRRVV